MLHEHIVSVVVNFLRYYPNYIPSMGYRKQAHHVKHWLNPAMSHG